MKQALVIFIIAVVGIKSFIAENNPNSMAIVSVRLPTGWKPNEESLTKLTNNLDIMLKRYELNENTVNFYFDEVCCCVDKIKSRF
jgi:hypothetical protein